MTVDVIGGHFASPEVDISHCGRKSAEDEIRSIQAELEALKGQQIDLERGRALWDGQFLAAGKRQGATDRWERADGMPRMVEAKLLQIEAAGGEPLTVCVGHRSRTVTVTTLGGDTIHPATLAPHGDGCGLVFRDSTSATGANPFAIYCPRCRQQSSRRARAKARAMAAGFEEIRPGVWFGFCRCGEPVESTDARRRQCDHCRTGHR